MIFGRCSMSSSQRDPNYEQISPVLTIVNIVVLYGFAGLVLSLPYYIGPFERGFFCDDESIRYPYKGNTVSAAALFGIAVGCAAITAIAGEFLVQNRIEQRIPQRKYQWGNRSVHALIVHCIVHFGFSQVGLVAVAALMNITKFCVGRLRPNFMHVCAIQNLNELCAAGSQNYIPATGYSCTGKQVDVREGRLSFFSGHSAISMYAAVYSVMYLQARLGRWKPAMVPLAIVQTLMVVGGLVICYTRVNDNWHHWSDVMVGIIVGVSVAVWTGVFWARLFAKENQPGYRKMMLPTYRSSAAITEATNGGPSDDDGESDGRGIGL